MKVTIVGAGNVGASCAEYIAQKEIASKVVLLDIKDGFACGFHLNILNNYFFNQLFLKSHKRLSLLTLT